ncbi:RNA polymerase sigma factor [Kitasatospora sp. NPDC088160]|uniref:RNA polymerase sigma factor n=1 Tax=Kitasatospora sp. NPDC088160 TaxID=3364072 RepID=UPI00380E9DAD
MTAYSETTAYDVSCVTTFSLGCDLPNWAFGVPISGESGMAECGGRCGGGRGGGGGKDFGPRPADRQSDDFNRVFTEMLPRLHRAAASLTGGLAAGDVVHDAYLRIARRPERFLSHPQPYAYVFTTMANILRDQWRRERRRVVLPDPCETAERERDRPPVESPSGGMAELQARWEVLRLLGCLTAKQARVVVLVDLDGYTVDEAAELLGLHRSTLAVTRRRAHGRLRAVLARERDHEREHEREGERDHRPGPALEAAPGAGSAAGSAAGPGAGPGAAPEAAPDAPS